ncbi:unnamed protein product [Closterium sp. Naga37s-1]|nr:unnamed protein product [Closterium sp. Naga37s-1]
MLPHSFAASPILRFCRARHRLTLKARHALLRLFKPILVTPHRSQVLPIHSLISATGTRLRGSLGGGGEAEGARTAAGERERRRREEEEEQELLAVAGETGVREVRVREGEWEEGGAWMVKMPGRGESRRLEDLCEKTIGLGVGIGLDRVDMCLELERGVAGEGDEGTTAGSDASSEGGRQKKRGSSGEDAGSGRVLRRGKTQPSKHMDRDGVPRRTEGDLLMHTHALLVVQGCSAAVCSAALCSASVCSALVSSAAVCSASLCSAAVCSAAVCSAAVCSVAAVFHPVPVLLPLFPFPCAAASSVHRGHNAEILVLDN